MSEQPDGQPSALPEPIEIVREVCARYGVKSSLVVSGSKIRFVCKVRHLAFRAVHEVYPDLGSKRFADLFGVSDTMAPVWLRKPVPVIEPARDPAEVLAEYFAATPGASRRVIMGREVSWYAVDQRHACLRYVAERCPYLSTLRLGKLFGLHHTTVLYALRRGKHITPR